MSSKSSLYEQRGVSSSKEEVHAATNILDKGLFPGAFCSLYQHENPNNVFALHADGAGTKAGLAYLMWKETDDLSVWRGIAQDAFVMNLDDLICVGATGPFEVSMSIDRNKALIPGEVLGEIIAGCNDMCIKLKDFGINSIYCGGETADVGDLVRTITVNNTFRTQMKKQDVIDASRITPGSFIVGFSSTGKASWEEKENSGMGSNGLTNARHDALSPYYRNFTETYAPETDPEIVYCGKHRLSDPLPGHGSFSVEEALLSPTRTYAPLMKELFHQIGRKSFQALIHCSGGGQTKIGKFGPHGIQYVKEELFPVPPLFNFLKDVRKMSWKEMYESYNMGHRMEAVISDRSVVDDCIKISQSMGIDAKVVGYVTKHPFFTEKGRGVRIVTPGKDTMHYDFPA